MIVVHLHCGVGTFATRTGVNSGLVGLRLEHKTCDILAAERLRLIKLGTRLIADYFQHTVNILKW